MTINYTSMTIEMTKAESKAAGTFGTDAYKDLIAAMQQFPTYKILVVTRAATKKTCEYKGLTYDYMKKYIEKHDDENKTIMNEYENLRGVSVEAKAALADSCSYKEIKAWFLNRFPEIEEFHTKRQNLLAAAN